MTADTSLESLGTILARLETRYGRATAPHALDARPEPRAPQAAALPHRVDSGTVAAAAAPAIIPAEVFLETLGFFTPSSKRIQGIGCKDTVVGAHRSAAGTQDALRVTIRARPDLGLPITSDLDYYRAFLRIMAEAVRARDRFRLPLAAPTKRVVRYAGKTVTPRTLREVHAWLERMTCTEIVGAVYSAKQGDVLSGFRGTVFRRVVHRGEPLKHGQIATTNYIWPAAWFLANYLRGHIRPLDLAVHHRLRRPIAKALYPLVTAGWYASGGQPYAKRYRALCADLLLRYEASRSRIQAQLDPAHRELHREGVVAHWTYQRAATGRDWVIRYWPGPRGCPHQQAADNHGVCRHARHTAADEGTPALSAEQAALLADVLRVCGDRHNASAYRKALRDYPVPLIRRALTATRQAACEGRITKTHGAFFVATLHRLARSCP
jgi:hypothetical protein